MTVQFQIDPSSGHVGGPVRSSEIKVIDAPILNYAVTDLDSEGKSLPRGELVFRGPTSFLGYLKN